MSEGKIFKFRGAQYRVIKAFRDTILAVNEDDLLEDIKRFANLRVVK